MVPMMLALTFTPTAETAGVDTILEQHLLTQQVIGMSCMAVFAAFESAIMESSTVGPAPAATDLYGALDSVGGVLHARIQSITW